MASPTLHILPIYVDHLPLFSSGHFLSSLRLLFKLVLQSSFSCSTNVINRIICAGVQHPAASRLHARGRAPCRQAHRSCAINTSFSIAGVAARHNWSANSAIVNITIPSTETVVTEPPCRACLRLVRKANSFFSGQLHSL